MKRMRLVATLAFVSLLVMVIAGKSGAASTEVSKAGAEDKGLVFAQGGKSCVQYKTIAVRYVCGTEQKCSRVKIMDSYTTYHYETVCVDVEKYCTRTDEVCVKWE